MTSTATGYRRTRRLLSCLLILSSPAWAQVRPLPGRPEVHPEDFSQVRGARELRDGRLLVSDYLEQRVVAVDFSTGRATSVVGKGGGPAEARLPTRIVAMPGDSSLLVDLGNQRLLVLDPAGRPARTIPGEVPGMLGVNGVAQDGALYYTIPQWAAARQIPNDTVEVVRLDRQGNRSVVARVQGDRMRSDIRAPALTPRIPTVGFATRDAWWASSDGTVRILRGSTYQLETRSPSGKSVTGPSHVWETPVVTPADRRRYVEEFLASSPTSGRGENGGMGQEPKPTEAALRVMIQGTQFGGRHPMFEAGAVLAAPRGEVWVGRPAQPGTPRRYDVLDSEGRMVRSWTVPAGRRVVTISARWIYLVATDDDGIEHLERYPLPAVG